MSCEMNPENLPSATERRGDTLNGFKDIRTENGSNQGHDLALTVLCVPNSFVGTVTPIPAHMQAGVAH